MARWNSRAQTVLPETTDAETAEACISNRFPVQPQETADIVLFMRHTEVVEEPLPSC